jgi:3-deoxy-manno-octulosonate cytidylyltransferase (CMP-KDO synthetase)
MSAIGIIPARFAASRFPGKPLTPILGRPMIQHVWEGCRSSKHLDRVLIATDHAEIAEICEAFGAEVVMTRDDHPTGTDRLAEVAESLSEEIVVNIQGDEPLIQGNIIDSAIDALLADPDAPMATLVHEAEGTALADPNRVKVLLDQRNRALYFSRNTIPALRDPAHRAHYWQHIGLYAYRREFLSTFVALSRTPYEQAEALEQLRALEHGYAIAVGEISGWHSTPVDVPEDIPVVEKLLRAAGRA